MTKQFPICRENCFPSRAEETNWSLFTLLESKKSSLLGKIAKSAGRGMGDLSNPLIPHAEQENSCAEVPKDGAIELAGGQVVFIHGEHQKTVY